MAEFYRFAGDHPVLTFLLFFLLTAMPVEIIKAICRRRKP